jgi:hypothetical protein
VNHGRALVHEQEFGPVLVVDLGECAAGCVAQCSNINDKVVVMHIDMFLLTTHLVHRVAKFCEPKSVCCSHIGSEAQLASWQFQEY